MSQRPGALLAQAGDPHVGRDDGLGADLGGKRRSELATGCGGRQISIKINHGMLRPAMPLKRGQAISKGRTRLRSVVSVSPPRSKGAYVATREEWGRDGLSRRVRGWITSSCRAHGPARPTQAQGGVGSSPRGPDGSRSDGSLFDGLARRGDAPEPRRDRGHRDVRQREDDDHDHHDPQNLHAQLMDGAHASTEQHSVR
jgi:hypothetical protein